MKKGTALNIVCNWYTNKQSSDGSRWFQEFRVSELEFQSGKPKDASVNPKASGFGDPKEPIQVANTPNYRFENPNTQQGADDEDDLPF